MNDQTIQEELVYECITLAGEGRVSDRSTFVSPSLFYVLAQMLTSALHTHSARALGPPTCRHVFLVLPHRGYRDLSASQMLIVYVTQYLKDKCHFYCNSYLR